MNPVSIQITSFGLSFAAGYALDLYNNYNHTVDKDLKNAINVAFKKALKDWSPKNIQIREDKKASIEKLVKSLIHKPELINSKIENSTELKTFLLRFEKELAKKQVAFNYLKKITDHSQFIQTINRFDSLDSKLVEIKEDVKKIKNEVSCLTGSEKALHDSLKFETKIPDTRIRNYGFESIGRKEQKQKIIDFYNSEKNCFLFIYGSGGMGKTHLVYDILNKINQEPLYFLANKNTTIEDLFLHCFPAEDSKIVFERTKVIHIFNSKFESEEINLIIDDFYEITDEPLRKLLINLRNIRKGKLLLISRALINEFADTTPIKIDKLDNRSMIEYINLYYKKDTELHKHLTLTTELIDELVNILKGYPLGVKFIFDLYKNVSAKEKIIDNIRQYSQESDNDVKIFMNRLLNSVIEHGQSGEMLLLKQASVFIKPIHIDILERLPAFTSQNEYKALIRKDFIWTSNNKTFELHALVRELLYEKNENKEELNEIAANYYEKIAHDSELSDMESFRMALYHSERAGIKHYEQFIIRQEELFGISQNIKSLINENYLGSIDRLKYRIELYPYQADSYNELAMLYLNNRDYINADKIVENGLKNFENNEYLLFLKAKILASKNHIQKAIVILDQILEINPINEIALLYQSRLYKQIDCLSESEKTLFILYYINENNLLCKFELGLLYRDKKDFDNAIKWLLPVAESEKRLAHYELGTAYHEIKEYDNAIKWLLPLAENDHFVSQFELGIIYREINQFDKAIKWLLPLAEKGDEPSQNALGILYRDNKKYNEAEKWLLPLAEKGDEVSQNALGILYRDRRDFENAIKWLLPLAKKGHIQSQNALGILYSRSKRFEEAIKWLMPLAEKNQVQPINALGILYRDRKEYKEAICWFNKAINLGNITSHIELGILYRQIKKYDEAVKWLLPLALKNNVFAQNELALTYRYWGEERYKVVDVEKIKLSKGWYLKAIALDDQNIQSCDGLAKVLILLEDYKDAKNWLKKGLKINPADSRILKRLVNLLFYNYRDINEASMYLSRLSKSKVNQDYIDKMEEKINKAQSANKRYM